MRMFLKGPSVGTAIKAMSRGVLSRGVAILSDPLRSVLILSDPFWSSPIRSDSLRSVPILSDPLRSSSIISIRPDPLRSSLFLSDPFQSSPILFDPFYPSRSVPILSDPFRFVPIRCAGRSLMVNPVAGSASRLRWFHHRLDRSGGLDVDVQALPGPSLAAPRPLLCVAAVRNWVDLLLRPTMFVFG